MSVRCPDCGAVASYGREIGHKSDCPSLLARMPVSRKDAAHRREEAEKAEGAFERLMDAIDGIADPSR